MEWSYEDELWFQGASPPPVGNTLGSWGVSCKEANTSATPRGQTLVGAGSTFTSVLFNHWFDEYQKQHPEVVINYRAVGSGEGVRRFIGKGVNPEEFVDFGASDAAMQDDEIPEVKDGVTGSASRGWIFT